MRTHVALRTLRAGCTRRASKTDQALRTRGALWPGRSRCARFTIESGRAGIALCTNGSLTSLRPLCTYCAHRDVGGAKRFLVILRALLQHEQIGAGGGNAWQCRTHRFGRGIVGARHHDAVEIHIDRSLDRVAHLDREGRTGHGRLEDDGLVIGPGGRRRE